MMYSPIKGHWAFLVCLNVAKVVKSVQRLNFDTVGRAGTRTV